MLLSSRPGVPTCTLCNVTVLAFTSPSAPSTFNRKGYATPPLVGLVLSVSVAGISVGGLCGLDSFSGNTSVGVGAPWLLSRSGAMRVASAKVGVGGARWARSSMEAVIWPRSVTAEWREREREREVRRAGARFFLDLRRVAVAGWKVVDWGSDVPSVTTLFSAVVADGSASGAWSAFVSRTICGGLV